MNKVKDIQLHLRKLVPDLKESPAGRRFISIFSSALVYGFQVERAIKRKWE